MSPDPDEPPRIQNLPEFEQGMQVFRSRIADAQRRGVCIICEQPPTFYSDAGRREYRISGTCEPCFDRMFEESPEDEGHLDPEGNWTG